MIKYIGDCPLCGGTVHWSTDHHMCTFNSIDNCLCECPFPQEFMEIWNQTPEIDIQEAFIKWLEQKQKFKTCYKWNPKSVVKLDLPYYPILGSHLIITKGENSEYVIKIGDLYIKLISYNHLISPIYPYEPTAHEQCFLDRHNS